MKKLLTLLLLGACLCVWAGNDPASYNLQRAQEAFHNGDEKTAFSFLSNELRTNPTNGYAHLYTAEVCEKLGYKSAVLNYGSKAIQLLWKAAPDYVATMACSIADIYLEAGDTVTALDYLDKALQANKKHRYTLLARAQLFEEAERAEQLRQVGEQYRRLYPKDYWGYVILARAYNMQARYDDALAQADKALSLMQPGEDPVEMVLRSRSRAGIGLKRYQDALSDAVKAARESMSYNALDLIAEIADSVPGSTVTDTVRTASLAAPAESGWPFILADIYVDRHDYVNAAYAMHEAVLIEPNAILLNSLGIIYLNHLNAPEEAEQLYLRAIQRDSTNESAYIHMASLCFDLRRYDDALRYADKALSLCSSTSRMVSALRTRGHTYQFMHRNDEALRDYYRALVAKPDDSGLWFRIGRLHRLAGDSLLADKAFEQGRLTIGSDSAFTAEAWLAMGDFDKAVEAAATMVQDPESPYQHYNAACVYAQAGQADRALDHLQSSFEYGLRNFLHIEWDTDLDNIRLLPRFNQLVERYKQQAEQDLTTLKQQLQQL
ncbi:MAG: tetratricopeptide repeat protein [Paludibacteraceae bacterium]|nr:tetratricopeptide repeat protein [Paludibacteraceae bacterium]